MFRIKLSRAFLHRHLHHSSRRGSLLRPLHNAPSTDQPSTFDNKQQALNDACKLSLAPMMEYTDRHFRHLVRLVSNRTLLYTEMVGASAVYHEQMDAKEAYREEHPGVEESEVVENYKKSYLHRFLGQGTVAPLEGPSVLQLGGSDPDILFHAAKTVMELTDRGMCDYTALNLNCGCPSPKVAGKGCFGAALMDDPQLVADVSKAMYEGTGGELPVTVKCRIGTDTDQPFTKRSYAEEVDEEEEYAKLCQFVETVASNGVVKAFDVHARIAVLQKSFSPADNRKIPPLKYNLVQRLTEDYPHLQFCLNGGIETIEHAQSLLEETPNLKGIMIGRAWAADPWRFSLADQILYGEAEPVAQNRLEVLKAYGEHADAEEAQWDPIKIRRFIVKAVVPLFAGEPNAKRYRVKLDEMARIPKQLEKQGKTLEGQPPVSELILNTALECLTEETLLRTPEESYERFLLQQSGGQVAEWQAQRKAAEAQGDSSYLKTLEKGAV